MHLENDVQRGASIRSVILRFGWADLRDAKATADYETKRKFVEALGVPVAWLDEALAYASGYAFQHETYCASLLKAGLWKDAETAFTRLLAPVGIFEEKESDLQEYVGVVVVGVGGGGA